MRGRSRTRARRAARHRRWHRHGRPAGTHHLVQSRARRTWSDGARSRRWGGPCTRSSTCAMTEGSSLDLLVAGSKEGHDVASLMRRDRHALLVEATFAPIHGRDTQPIGSVVTFRNVTRAKRRTDELAYQASHDALTGVANRRAFEAQLQRALESAAQAGMPAFVAVPRHGSLQGGQRQCRPCRRRRVAAAAGGVAEEAPARSRRARATGRRRVRRAAGEHRCPRMPTWSRSGCAMRSRDSASPGRRGVRGRRQHRPGELQRRGAGACAT